MPRIVLICLEAVAALVVAVCLAGGLLAWRLASGPIDLSFARAQIASELSRLAGGRNVTLDSLRLEWSPDRRRVEASAVGVSVSEAGGGPPLTSDRIGVDLDTLALLSGDVRVTGVALSGGAFTVQRSAAGCFSATIGPPPEDWAPSPDIEAPSTQACDRITPAEIMDALRRGLAEAERTGLEAIEVADATVTVLDVTSGERLTVSPVSLTLSIEEDAALLRAEGFTGAGEEGAQARYEVNAVTPRNGDGVTVEMLADAAPVSLIAALAGRQGWAATGPARLRADLDARGAPRIVEASIDWTGIVHPAAPMDTLLQSVAGDMVFDLRDGVLDLTELVLVSTRGRAEGDLRLQNVAGLSDPGVGAVGVAVDLTLDGADLTPVFETVWPDIALRAQGDWRPDEGRLFLGDLSVDVARLSAEGSASLTWAGLDFARPPRVVVDVTAGGFTDPATVFRFWPPNLGGDARTWVRNALARGTLRPRRFRMDAPREAFEAGQLQADMLNLRFDFEDASVRFLSDLPPVSEGQGQAILSGNGFRLDVDRAVFSGWSIQSGELDIPYFEPDGALLSLRLDGFGPVGAMLRTLDRSRLAIGREHGVPVEEIEGDASAVFRLTRPIGAGVSDDAIAFEAVGQAQNGAYPRVVAGLNLTDVATSFRVTRETLTLDGAGVIERTPVEFAWRQVFDDVDSIALDASLPVNPDLLNRFGFPARQLFRGDAPGRIEARAYKDGDFRRITTDIDLTPVIVDLFQLDYEKPAGAPGRMRAVLTEGEGGAAELALSAESDDATADAVVIFGEERRLDRIRLNAIRIPDSIDGAGEVVFTPDLVETRLTGAFADLTRYVSPVIAAAQTGLTGQTSGAAGPPTPRLSMTGDVDRLRLREGLEYRDARFDFLAGPEGPERLSFTGRSEAGARIDTALAASDEGGLTLNLTTEDASALMQVLFDTDIIDEGAARIEGVIGHPELGARLRVRASDLRVREAPLLAQVLSLGSLRGLADTLSGEGIYFSDADATLSFRGATLQVEDASFSGPAMGVTLTGAYGFTGDTLDFEGVLVPSFGVNSALGAIPLIGDLFVSRQGEGVVGLTYSIRGDLSRATVAVNPLSALTPGVLRRLFQGRQPPPSAAAPAPTEPAPQAP